MFKLVKKLLPILFMLLAISCSHTDHYNDSGSSIKKGEPSDLNMIKNEIKQKTLLFTEAHITKDTSYLNNIFTSDARVFPPNSEIVSGRNKISILNYDWVNYGIHEFKEESIFIYGNQDLIIDEGTYYLRYGSDNFVDRGKYINIWKNENGTWKIYSNIWNSNLPIE